MARSKVLVVEDEREVAQVIVEALTQAGCACVHVEDADAADRVLASEEIGAVTLDLCMPGRSGLEWLEAVHREHPDLARKTLVVTGTLLDEPGRQRIARCGAGLLQKPFSLKVLVQEVLDRLSGKNSRSVPD